MPDWVNAARKELLLLSEFGPGWGYRREESSCVEPTALACLAIQATSSSNDSEAITHKMDAAAQWLASIQQPNGELGLSATLLSPNWPTPYAILVWANREGYVQEISRAMEWLLGQQGQTYPQEPGKAVGADSSIVGWPWVGGTSSWLEPTALAVLALQRQGMGGHDRAIEGLRLIRDRAISSGGWNFGNNVVYSTNLRPQPAETGIALVALRRIQTPDAMVEKACAYLQHTLPVLRSAQSLAWGLLGLTAWGQRPSEADQWLAEAFERAVLRPDAAPQLAYLLLAASGHSLFLLGAEGPK